jgi:predicted nuclease of restriction endonuclease-like (RecB) superfamily
MESALSKACSTVPRHGWSRKILEAQISSGLRDRQGNALSSFERALPAPDSEMVREAIKDPYNFEFLNLSAEAKERDLELALLNDVQSFLMEMGHGFALVGRQFPLRVPDEESSRPTKAMGLNCLEGLHSAHGPFPLARVAR